MGERAHFTTDTLLFKFVCPIILILGIYGNVMTIIIIYRLRKHYKAFTLLFIAMSVSHTCVLLLCLLPRWTESLAHLRLGKGMEGNWVCYIDTWILYSLAGISSWFEMTMTTFKMAVVVWPHIPKATFVKKMVKTAIVIIVTIQIILNANVFLGFSIDEEVCYLGSTKYFKHSYTSEIIVWMNIMNIVVVPFVVIIANDIVLSTKLHQSSRSVIPREASISWKYKSQASPFASVTAVSGVSADPVKRYRPETAKTITCIVIVAAVFYFLSWAPMFLAEALCASGVVLQKDFTTTSTNILTLIFFFSFSTNFYIYYCTGRRFRKEYKQFREEISKRKRDIRSSTPTTITKRKSRTSENEADGKFGRSGYG